MCPLPLTPLFVHAHLASTQALLTKIEKASTSAASKPTSKVEWIAATSTMSPAGEHKFNGAGEAVTVYGAFLSANELRHPRTKLTSQTYWENAPSTC